MPVHVHVKWHSHDCPACGTRLLETAGGLTGGVEIGSPLIVCSKCSKTSYTRLRREWYNYPNKDLLWLIPLVAAVGIGILVTNEYGPLGILLGGGIIAFAVGSGALEAKRIAQSKRRMREPEYLAKLLRWQILRQEEYDEFMRRTQK